MADETKPKPTPEDIQKTKDQLDAFAEEVKQMLAAREMDGAVILTIGVRDTDGEVASKVSYFGDKTCISDMAADVFSKLVAPIINRGVELLARAHRTRK